MRHSGIITNGFLKPLQDRIEITTGNSLDRLQSWAEKNAVPLSLETFGTAIDWDSLSHYETPFYYQGSEDEIRAALSVSDLLKSDRLVIVTGQDAPVLLVATEVFVENWNSFWAASGYMQLIVFSEDSRYFLEFEDNSFVLHSNFKIR